MPPAPWRCRGGTPRSCRAGCSGESGPCGAGCGGHRGRRRSSPRCPPTMAGASDDDFFSTAVDSRICSLRTTGIAHASSRYCQISWTELSRGRSRAGLPPAARRAPPLRLQRMCVVPRTSLALRVRAARSAQHARAGQVRAQLEDPRLRFGRAPVRDDPGARSRNPPGEISAVGAQRVADEPSAQPTELVTQLGFAKRAGEALHQSARLG